MRFLLVSAFAENGRESGANRLRKLRFGLEQNGAECFWLGPVQGFIAHGAGKKIATTLRLLQDSLRWARRNQDGLVLISLPPPWLLPTALLLSVFLPGRLLVDFRDPILNQRINTRSGAYRTIMGWLEAAVICRARLVILAAARIRHFLAPASTPAVTVLAGLDDRELLPEGCTGKPRSRHKVIYGGTFYGSRSPMQLLEAIAENPVRLNFEFYVSFNEATEAAEVRAKIASLGLAEKVKIYDQVSRDEFMRILREAGAGLVITHSEGSEYAIPGKIFDYITAGVLPWVISRDQGLLEFLKQSAVRATITSGWTSEELGAGLRELERLLEEKAETDFNPESLSARNQAKILLDALTPAWRGNA